MTTRICITCKAQPVTSAHLLKRSMYYCRVCWRDRPCNLRAQRTHLNPKRLAQSRAFNRRQYYLSRERRLYAETPEQAQALTAYIRRRKLDFKEQQREPIQGHEGGAEMESGSA